MTKTNYILLLIGGFFLSLIPIIFYFFSKFPSSSLSEDLNVWNMFGQYIGGTTGPIISILTLGVTAWIAIEFNDYQKRQTTIQLFKEFRTKEFLTTRSKAWEVKKNWDDKVKTNYKDKFITALRLETPTYVDGTFITKKQIKSIYDIFAFFTMLSTYKNQGSTLKQLNYFYYPWWRQFLYEVAEKFDIETTRDLNPALKNINGFDFEEFCKGIKLLPKLWELDKICGFEKLFEKKPLIIYEDNS